MAKKIALIEKRNRPLMTLISQLLGAPTPSVIEHRDGYATSPFVENMSKASLSKKLNLPILTVTYDESTDPTEHVTQYKRRMWQASIPWHLSVHVQVVWSYFDWARSQMAQISETRKDWQFINLCQQVQ